MALNKRLRHHTVRVCRESLRTVIIIKYYEDSKIELIIIFTIIDLPIYNYYLWLILTTDGVLNKYDSLLLIFTNALKSCCSTSSDL